MGFDGIVVALFLLAVAYVVNQAVAYIEQQTSIKFLDEEFKNQLREKTLEEKSLFDLLDITFRFEPPRYKYSFYKAEQDEQPRSLFMTVRNKSKDVNIYIDWNQSSITDYKGTSRRVIRLGMDERLNPAFYPLNFQVPSPVAPGCAVTSRITAEDILKAETDEKSGDKFLKPSEPILSLSKLQADIKNKKLPKEVRERREKQKLDFEEWRNPLEFSIRLMLRMADLNKNKASEYQYALLLKFTVNRVVWRHVLPWNPKK
jgi:hypothetical protein